MPRKLPTHYISPSAVSITPNANGSQNDLAVYVAKGAKIKVYLPAAGIDMQNAAFQEWTFSGRNRRLAESGKPYTIYARLSIDNKSDGYLVFAVQVKDGGVWYDKYGSHKTSESPEDIQVYSLAKGKEDECYVSLAGGYYYVRLGWVTLPDDGKRSVEFDTGILGTDQYNAEWSLDPDSSSLRVELTGSIDGEDAGERPYVPWGKTLNLQAKLVEGWYTGDAGAVDQWTIVRDTGDEEADAAWNQGPSAQAFMESGNILFEHQEGGTDDFNNAVAAVFTVTAWKKEEVSSDSGEESGQPAYTALASNSMTVVTEASEYISKLKDDTAAGIITFLKGLVSRGDVVVNGLLTAYNAVMNTIKSSNYTGDGVTDSGWSITNDYAGSSRLVVDYLYARKKAVFESLEIKELQFTSGDLAQSLASATIERTDYLQVDEQGEETILGYSDRKIPWTLKGFLMRLSSSKPYALARNKKIRINLKPEDLQNVNRVRCYFLAKDDNKKIFNLWKENDLARCQTFNIDNIDRETYAGETHKAGNVYWWRLVKKISKGAVTVDGKEYHYFDVAYGFDAEQEANRTGIRTSWCDILSDLPAAGDKVVQFGNTEAPARMNIIVSEVNGEGNIDAPSVKSYRGVHTFNTDDCWWGGESCRKMMLSPSSGVEFYAPSFKFITEYGIERIQVERGAWLAIPFEEDTEHETFPDYSDDILDENGNFVSRSDGSPKNYVRKCRYYDRVEHKGSTWLCTIAESHYWRKYDNGVWSKITEAQYQALPQEEKDKCEEVRNYTTDEPSKASNDWTVSAERGQDGSFKSRVFCRTNINIKNANVRGGSYDNPIPTLTKIGDDVVEITWEDGVPQGTEMLWSTVCTFYGDGSNSGWSKPSQETDTETLDIEFSPEATRPDVPVGTAADRNTQETIEARQAQGWYDPSRLPADQQMIYRAECKIKNGVYETKDGNPAWVIARIKGEKGTSVREVKPYYAKQSPESYNGVPPQDGWEESIAALGTIAEGWYVWTKNVISFTDNVESTTTYTVSKWGIDGDGIENIETKFYESANLLTQTQLEGLDESDWKEYNQLALTKGDYIYTRTKITYDKDDTPTISYQVNRLGQDGVGYVATEEYYVLGNSQTDVPTGHPYTGNQPYKKYTAAEWQQIQITGGWSESRPTYQGDDKKFLWNFEVSFDTDGNAMVTRPICIGNYAKGIVSIVETYAISASAVAPQAGGYPSDITTWTDEAHDCAPTDEKPYQWNKTVTSYSDGTSDTFYHVSAVKGTRGQSVSYDEEHSSIGYAYSSMGTPESGRDYPSDITSWSQTPPAVQKGKYLWTKDVTAYNNGGTLVYTTTYGVQYQPNDGESVEIDSSRTFIKYCRQTKSQYTGQHPADSDFLPTYPTNLGQGDYLWILNQVAYVGVANPLKSYSVSMLGADGSKGDPGADGYTTHFAYATSADGSQNFSTTNFNGATYIGTYRDQLPNDSTDYRDYVWTPWKGDKGDSVAYDEEHSSIGYAYSSMGTPEAGRDYPSDITSWSPTPPAVQKGKYLWTKDVTAYNNAGTIVYTTTYGVQYQPNDGESVEIDSSRTFIKYCRQTKSQYAGQHPADSNFSTTYPTNLGQGDYLWILNQVAYVGVANPLKSYSVSMLGTDGSKGDPGADGYTTHFAYATSADGSQNFSTTNFNGATYIGTYRDQLPNDSTDYRDYVWTPWKGDKGDSVSYDEEHSSIGYAYSSMGTPESGRDYPSDITSWSPTPPAVQKGKYLWTKDVTAYDNAGTIVYTTTYGVQYQPNDGESVEIDSSRTFIKYCRQTKSQYTGQHPADSNFSTTYPTNLGQGDYLWILNQVAYVGVANPLKSYSVSMLGTDGSKGDPGADGYTTHFAYATSADGSQNFSTTNFNGATYIGTYRDRNAADSTNYRDYVWTPWKGDKGDSVAYDEEHSSIGYAYSSMGTPEAGRDYPSDITSWSPTPPAVQKGKYLWTKDVTAYDNAGTIVYTTTYGVQYQPNDGESVEIDSSRTFIKYCRQTKSQYTGQHPADSNFSPTYPTNLGQGDYLWILNQVAYVGVANPLKSYSVSMLGTDGSKGDPGADGYTTHFAYATSADGSQNFSTTNFNGATYIGTYRDRNAADSTYYRDYVWTPWKGDKGDQGDDGYGLSLTPTSLILESMISSGQEVVNYVNNVVTVRVMKGSTPVQLTCSVLTGTSSHSSNISISSSNIPVYNAGTYSTVTLAGGINLSNGESGFFTVRVSTSDGKFSQDVRINFYVNRAATFTRQIKNGIETAMGAQTEYSYDQLGGVIKTAYQADIQTSAKGLTQQFTEQISRAGADGRNLFGFAKGVVFGSFQPFIQGYGIVSNVGSDGQAWIHHLGFEGKPGAYTITFQARMLQQSRTLTFCLWGYGDVYVERAVSTNWQYYELHFNITTYPNDTARTGQFYIDGLHKNNAGVTQQNSNWNRIVIRHLKIERSTEATNFCEADEDVAYLGQGNVAKNLSWIPYNASYDIYPASGTGRDNAYRVYVNLNQTAPWGYDGANPRTSWDYIYQSNVLKIKAGRCYTLTFWAKSSTSGFVISQFLYPNIITTDIGSDLYVDASAGTIRECVMSDGCTNIQLSTTWKQYFVHLYATVGDGQSDYYYVNVIPLRISKNLNGTRSGYVYMSDIELQEGYVTSADYFTSFISQNARRISLVQQSGTKLAGVDIQNGTVNLMGDRVIFSNSTGTVSGRVWIDPDDGTIHATYGKFSGEITATGGSITGYLNVTGGLNVLNSGGSAVVQVNGSGVSKESSNEITIVDAEGFYVKRKSEGFRLTTQGFQRWNSSANSWVNFYGGRYVRTVTAYIYTIKLNDDLIIAKPYSSNQRTYLPKDNVPDGKIITIINAGAYGLLVNGNGHDIIGASVYSEVTLNINDRMEFIYSKDSSNENNSKWYANYMPKVDNNS